MSEASSRTLCIKNLAKRYGKRWVVQDVSFKLNDAEIVGLLGPNGAGKTTSFYMLVGLVSMDKGSIELSGEDISDLAMHKRAKQGIGYLPQEASIFRKLSVEKNILSILELRDDLNGVGRKEALESLLDEFNLQPIRKSPPINTTDPATKPPPSTRSNSLKPVE